MGVNRFGAGLLCCLAAAMISAAAVKSMSLVNDWQADAAYPLKCAETPALWSWRFGMEGGQAFVSTPNLEHRSMFEEGPYLVNIDPITRKPRPWSKFKMTIEYRVMDQVAVPPRPKVFPAMPAFPLACSGLADRQPPIKATNEHFSNSGVYIYDRYEVQIIDPSRFTPAVAEGGDIANQQVVGQDGKVALLANRNQLLPGGMYKLDPPNGQFKNRSKPWPNAAQMWNSLEIEFCPPDPPPARIRTRLNGNLIFEGELKDADGPLTGTGSRKKGEKDKVDKNYVRFLKEGPIFLQSHWGSHVDYRNPVIESIDTCTVPKP